MLAENAPFSFVGFGGHGSQKTGSLELVAREMDGLVGDVLQTMLVCRMIAVVD